MGGDHGRSGAVDFLKRIGYEQYVDMFVREGADSTEEIKMMDDSDLQAMGIAKRMHRKRILKEAEKL